MERRIVGTSASLPRRHGAGVLPLVAVLLVVGGPGVAQGAARQAGGGSAGAGPTQPWVDPIGDQALTLEYDPERIFRFVADEIRYEPYPGVLRGARGTLAAGAGNSVDKALLLGALLDKSLVRYRFAQGPLDQVTSSALLDSLSAEPDAARQMARAPLERGLEQAATAGEALPPPDNALAAQIDQDTSAVAADSAKRIDAAMARLGDTVTMIEDALHGAGIDLPSGTDTSLPVAETSAHTWVQMMDGTSWVDLDPTFAGARRGAVLTQPTDTLPALPDDLRTAIEFGVMVETLSAGQLTTNEVLTYHGYADELAETPVTFVQGKPSGFKSIGVTLGNLVGEGWVDYRPALFVGSQVQVADHGVAFPSGSGTDLFGTEATGAPTGPVEGEATAEWLEVRVTPPGEQVETIRRTVFDRLPAEMRTSGTLTPSAIPPIELVDDGNGSMDYLPMLGARTFAIATGPTTAASVGAVRQDALAMFGLAYHTVRDALGTALAIDAGARTFIDGPNIVAVTIDVDEDAGARITQAGLDIWRHDEGVLPLSGPAIGTARSKLIAGVLGQVAERFAVEEQAGDPHVPVAVTDVGAVFDAAKSQGVDTVVLRDSLPATLPYGPEASALITEAVASGDVVVVPAEPVLVDGHERVGWWKVDPRTGVTTDVMDDGSGASMGEYILIVDEEIGNIYCEGVMARRVAKMLHAAAVILGGYGNIGPIYDLYLDGFQGVQCS